ncbi:hypothetical protein CVT26_008830 [Gymnopilus dilepis]|uniref:Uncharacterized protein n=1 Tax=Gymnopilus dilepis TaxID=231916 RepID=A0A409WP80_9AGAR|nr:hypothetical protein CVT26_008830 [Gymnopilus dilepis]
MSDLDIRQITELRERETAEIVDLLVRAYQGNAAVEAMTGGNKDLESLLFRAMTRAGALAGHLYVLESHQEGILSVALWYPPGRKLFGSEEERKLGFEELLSNVDEEARSWWTISHPKRMADFLERWLPKANGSYYLIFRETDGTDPRHQRKGYATRLLDYAVQHVITSPNLIAFCSIGQEHADFYARAGFPIRGRTDLLGRGRTFPAFGHSREV